jgi:hypothetical protein
MTSEAELKEAVKKLLCFGFCGEDDSAAEDEFICSPLCKTNQQSTTEAVHTLYLEAGYVQLTRDEARYLTTVSITDDGGEYNFHLSRSIQAKLRSRLEVKE